MTKSWLKWVILSGGALILMCISFPVINLYRVFYQPMPIDLADPPIIVLNKSSSAVSFVNDLSRRHLIGSSDLLLRLIRSRHLTSALKAGVYQVKSGESAWQFLQRVISGDVLVESFRIINGTTLKQVSDNLERAPYLNYNRADWLLIANSHFNAEGLLLADTYRYDGGSQSKTLLMQAHRNLLSYLDKAWQSRDVNVPYKTAYEMLIAASILEKETAKAEEKYLISGVIANRLKKNMPLQMDPTVIYGLGSEYKGKLTHQDLQKDTPYNTYCHRGLPPTPIAMVAKDAIDAAAHPKHTDYLYFVAKGDGTHEFSKTYKAQKQAIHRYNRKINES